MFKNYFLTAWRSLRKNGTASLLNMFGLAAGMTAAILIFIWVDNERSFDRYHPDSKHIYRITSYIGVAKWTWETAPLALVDPIRKQIPEVQTVSCIRAGYDRTTVRLGNELFTESHLCYIDSAWFSLFHYDFVRGDPAGFFSHPFNLLLTESKAKKYFAARDPIGQTLRIDSITYRVAAIVKDNPANSSFQFDMLIPNDAWLSDPGNRAYATQPGNFEYQVFLKLRPDGRPGKVATSLANLLRNGDPNNKDDVSLTPLKDIHFETGLNASGGNGTEHASRKTANIFTILGVLILFIACVNYVNLTTARASTRAKEVGVRKIIGAGRSGLFAQFTFESALVSVASLMISALLVQSLMPWFRQLTGRNFTDPLLAGTTWSIFGVTLFTATLLNSVYPSLVLSSFRPLNALKGATMLRFKDVSLRRGLVVIQFVFSIILIAGTIIMHRQLNYVHQINPGYDRTQVFEFNMSWRHGDKAQAMKHDLQALNGIAGVTTANESIVNAASYNSGSIDWDGRDTSYRPTVYKFSPDHDFARVMGIHLAQGRWFDPNRPGDRNNFILNETAAGEFNIHKPVIGQRLMYQGDTGVIIGIVKDFHFASLHEKIRPFVFRHPTEAATNFYIKTKPGKIAAALANARAIWSRYITDAPFDYNFLDDEFNNLYKADMKTSTLILLFSLVAIMIACLGLVGLASFTARQRLKEIGIRKVLGASTANITVLLSTDFIRLVFLAVLIATPISWWAMRQWLQDFAYHIPLSAWTFTLAGGLAVLVALLTVSSQSVKAATANPVDNLRSE
ncbi:MAG TPA: ABC transporter permease [Puia sp.]|nr:ABC transporter permease [Puia sp.]